MSRRRDHVKIALSLGSARVEATASVRIDPKSKKRPPIASSDGDESHRWREGTTDAASAQFIVVPEHEEVLDRARLTLINDILLAQSGDASQSTHRMSATARGAWGLGRTTEPQRLHARREFRLPSAPVGTILSFVGAVSRTGRPPSRRGRFVFGDSAATGGV